MTAESVCKIQELISSWWRAVRRRRCTRNVIKKYPSVLSGKSATKVLLLPPALRPLSSRELSTNFFCSWPCTIISRSRRGRCEFMKCNLPGTGTRKLYFQQAMSRVTTLVNKNIKVKQIHIDFKQIR